MIMQSNLIRQSLKAPSIILRIRLLLKVGKSHRILIKQKHIDLGKLPAGKIIENNILSVFSGLSGNGTFIAPLTKKTSPDNGNVQNY